MLDRATRLAPLTGFAFVILVLVGGPVLEQTTPDDTASPAKVIAFYVAHRNRERAGVFVLAFAFVAFLYFAAALRARWRELPGCEGLATVLVAAAAIEVAGQCITAGGTFALAAHPSQLEPDTAHALNLVANDLVVTSAAGALLFGLTAGLMILRGPGVVPAWLGWVAIVMGVLFVVPPVEFAGFFVLLLWVLVVSTLLVRTGRPAPALPEVEQAHV